MESPLRLTAHGGFGEGDGETRLSRGRKVCPVPTLLGGWGAAMPPGYPTTRPGYRPRKSRLHAHCSRLSSESDFHASARRVMRKPLGRPKEDTDENVCNYSTDIL
jgi:hypothetical protein